MTTMNSLPDSHKFYEPDWVDEGGQLSQIDEGRELSWIDEVKLRNWLLETECIDIDFVETFLPAPPPDKIRYSRNTLLKVLSRSCLQLPDGAFPGKRLHIPRVRLNLKKEANGAVRFPRFAQVGAEGIWALCDMINAGRLINLESLDVGADRRFYTSPDMSMSGMLQRGKLPVLQSLTLSHFNLPGSEIVGIAQAIKDGKLSNLTSLSLLFDQIDDGIIELAESLKSGTIGNLRYLSLCHNGFGDEGGKAIADALKSGKIMNIERLDLSHNKFGYQGVTAIAEALKSGSVSNLEEVDLSWNKTGNMGAMAIDEALRSGKMSKLRTLSLGWNKITDDVIMVLVAERLKTGAMTRVERVGLAGNVRSDAGLLKFAEALSKSSVPSALKRLSIFPPNLQSNLSTSVRNALVSAFMKNKHLTLDLEEKYWDEAIEEDRAWDHSFRETLAQLRRNNLDWRDTLQALSNEEQVPAPYAKVFFCGRPRVGKTELRTTLEKTTESFMQRRVMSVFTRHKEQASTRGIEVSHIPAGLGNASRKPKTELAIWDLAGQREYEVLHSSFLPDIGLADGSSTFFVVVCSENMPRDNFGSALNDGCSSHNNFPNAVKDLKYWLRFIASSSPATQSGLEGAVEHPHKVFVVVNCFNGERSGKAQHQAWRAHLEEQQKNFKGLLHLSINPCVLDARSIREVEELGTRLNNEVHALLQQTRVSKVCETLLKSCKESLQGENHASYPVLQWREYCLAVGMESGPLLKAATNYLHHAGHLIWFKEAQPLVEGRAIEGAHALREVYVSMPTQTVREAHTPGKSQALGQASVEGQMVEEGHVALEANAFVVAQTAQEAQASDEARASGKAQETGEARTTEEAHASQEPEGLHGIQTKEEAQSTYEAEESHGAYRSEEPQRSQEGTGHPGQATEEVQELLETSRRSDQICGSVVILSPEYFCKQIVGQLLLPDHMLGENETIPTADYMNPDHSLRLATVGREVFKVPRERCDEMVQIILRLGLGYAHSNNSDMVFIPALIRDNEEPFGSVKHATT